MGDLRDLYMQGMDVDNSLGIKGKGQALMQLLKRVDFAVHKHLVDLDVNPQFFAMRWITTLLSRELMLPDTVRLWDSLFADATRFDFLLQACCAMIVLQRKELLASDFSGCLQLLQKYPPTDVVDILKTALQIRKNPDGLFSAQADMAQVRLKGAASSTLASVTSSLNTEQLLQGASSLASVTSDFVKKSGISLFSSSSPGEDRK